MAPRYDLVVLGGGTAGLVSSFIAAAFGARVAMVERGKPGGDCLWTGCVPSKSLIAAANLAHEMRTADRLGLAPHEPEVDLATVMDSIHANIAVIEHHDSIERLESEGVEVVTGQGKFLDPRTIEVGGRRLNFCSAIVATGSEPAAPPVDGLEGDDVSDTDSIWELRELPERLVVMGGGPIGCELGQAFARLGSRVTIVELADRLLVKEEPEASELIRKRLAAEGVEVLLETKAEAVRRSEAGAELVVTGSDGEGVVGFDRVLSATGRKLRSEGFGFAAAGIRLGDGGAVATDERLRTSAKGIYAAGDITGRHPFTHVAAHHARIATANALIGPLQKISDTVPWTTFTDPEVGRVGMTVAAARRRWGANAKVARADYEDLDRAITEGRPYGFALLVGDPKGKLVGATVAAPGGGEAIAELTARVAAGDKIDSVSTTIHSYPTLAEGPSRAADNYLRERYSKPIYRRAGSAYLRLRRLLSR